MEYQIYFEFPIFIKEIKSLSIAFEETEWSSFIRNPGFSSSGTPFEDLKPTLWTTEQQVKSAQT